MRVTRPTTARQGKSYRRQVWETVIMTVVCAAVAFWFFRLTEALHYR